MASTLKIIFINVNSIVSRHKRHYLNLFLREHQPDVLLIVEHRLSPRHTLDIRGYKIYRQNRFNRPGGGTAVFVRDSLCSKRVITNLGSVENTAVKISRVDGSAVTVIAMYLRPQETLLVNDLDAIQHLSARESVLIGADLNARHSYWGDSYCNRSGHNLRDFLLSCPDMDIYRTDGPTRITETSASFLDVFMASSDLSVSPNSDGGLETLDYESDHRAVVAIVSAGNFRSETVPTIFNFNKINKNRLNEVLARELPSLELPIDRNVTPLEIDNNIEQLNLVFHRAMNESIPKIECRSKGLQDLPPNILHLISEKKRLKRVMSRTLDPARYLIFKADIRNLDKIIQGAIAVFEQSYWTKYLENVRVNHKTFQHVKRAAGILKKEPLSDLIDNGGTLLSEDAQKAELLADRFCEIHKGGSANRTASFENLVNREINFLYSHEPHLTFGLDIMADGNLREGSVRPSELYLVSTNDIKGALKMKPNKKSSGKDKIPDCVLKKTDSVTWHFLAVLFNHCLNLGYFPASWKEALIVPIPKSGSNPRRVENYRPISLLSSFGKLFERFILSKIQDKIMDGGILKECQFGFRSNHSTTHALMLFTNYVADGLNKRYPTLTVSLDLAKAFDTVWQEGIVYKMLILGFDRSTCQMVAAFLKSRTFKIKVGNELSPPRPIEAGVPQGSLLGPVLYNIFVSDIPQPQDGDLLLMYADDMLIASKGPHAGNLNRKMNTYLNTLNEYFKKWGLKLNIDKTDGVLIKGRRSLLYPNARKYVPNLNIGGRKIRTSDRIKYLGIIFHENFEYYRHIDYIQEKVKKVYYLYNSLLRRRGGLSVRVKLLLYTQVIRPLISYAFPAWFRISSSQMERLRRWERRILTSCLNLFPRMCSDGTFRRPSNRSIYNKIEFQRIDAYMISSAIKFLEKAQSIDNNMVVECFIRASNLETVRTHKYYSPVDLLALRDGNLLHRGADLLFYHRRINTLNIENVVYNTAQ